MSSQVLAILKSFDALSDVEKQSVAGEILHRIPGDETLPGPMLDALADELFAALDAEESANAVR